MDKFTKFIGGTSSKGANINVSNDYQAAARAEQQRQRELQTRRDDLIRQTERRQAEQRQAETRQAEERRQAETRQAAERRQAEIRQAEQRQREAQQRSSAGNGGGSGNNTPPGNSGGSPPSGGDPLRKFDRDIRNLADPRARVESYKTDPLNTRAREDFKKHHPDKEHIPPYQANDYLYRTKTNPNPNPKLPVAQFHQDGKHSDWHASIREMERKAQLRFNASSYNDVGKAVQRYLDLPHTPTHSSIGRLGSVPTKVDISYTVSGKQQAEVRSKYMNYSETRPISELFSWLKFKP